MEAANGDATNLTELAHRLSYAAYSWGFEAGKVGDHVDTTTAGNKASAALDLLIAAQAAELAAVKVDALTSRISTLDAAIEKLRSLAPASS